MLFPTVTFAVFFMVVLPVSWALMRRQVAWRGCQAGPGELVSCLHRGVTSGVVA